MNITSNMSIGTTALCATFLAHSVVLLLFEPAMGFREFADFFDLDKVLPALGSTAWKVGNIAHVLTGFGLLFLASGTATLDVRRAGVTSAFGYAAAPLFVIVGMSGIVGDQLVGLLSDPLERDAAVLGMIMGSRTMGAHWWSGPRLGTQILMMPWHFVTEFMWHCWKN